ncbi:MAG: DNA polymerase [bacterium]
MRFVTNQQGDREEVVEKLLRPRDYVAVDIETVSLENRLALGIGIAVDKETGYYFFNMRDELIGQVLSQTPVVLAFNASFDIPLLQKLGHTVNDYDDVMLMCYTAGLPERSLAALSEAILHAPYTAVTSQWKKKTQGNIGIDHVKMAGWCIQHALNTYNLYFKVPKTSLYRTIDRPFVDLIIEMEKWGLEVDQHRLTEVEQETIEKVQRLEASIKEELGLSGINLASNPQVAAALQTKGIIGTRRTGAGAVSVGEESLKPLNLPLTNNILKWRSLMKTITTYVPAFRAVDHEGRIHTKFGYTNTGRLSSSDPNLQNLTRDEKFAEEEA